VDITKMSEQDRELVKSLRNTAEFLWNEGWYAKSMRLSEAADKLEGYAIMFDSVRIMI
jgi:hypothetical protein